MTVTNLQQTLLRFLAEHSLLSTPLVIAYSGGCDSQALLHAAAHLQDAGHINGSLKAIHVHHGLSDNADSWQQFTQTQANSYGVDYLAVRVQLDAKAGLGIEASARKARYNALSTNSAEHAVILTAHHQDDQLETMLLALKRGAGVAGLAAMRTLRTGEKQQRIGRPLLTVSRQEIECYAKYHQLAWIDDESNQDQRFERNFLRQNVLPLLTRRWPHILNSSQRSARHLAEAQALLDEYGQRDIEHILGPNDGLLISELLQFSIARQRHLIRQYCQRYASITLSEAQLNQVHQTCVLAKQDATPKIELAGGIIRRYQNQLVITQHFNDVSDWQFLLAVAELPQRVELPDNLGYVDLCLVNKTNDDKPAADGGIDIPLAMGCQHIQLDCHYHNDKVWPQFRDKRRQLNKVYQELAIAPWLRKRQIYLRVNDQLAAVVGQFINKDYLQTLDQSEQSQHNTLRIYRHNNKQ
ncbi:tRNA lysidine(34) synthetase TilS [Thalassotalea ponticola]|uniref:tRNA lysidine(34) synthetase TilS n=1 Tax=Thalassotalea ponticola TaxID=1523392 RepID=UPI0025B30266|nr:tRNA lysidine(34) synthetase TilS [Thalassotalea ponticola]MDN3652538.1 tRNA lysidine(34) synthetase TilS [Thalassotalea ponticola]